MKRPAILLALLVWAVHGEAQWQRVTQLPAREISCVTNVDGILYASMDSLIYISGDGGDSWSPTARISKSIEIIGAITRFGGRLFVGTSAHGVYTSTNNGESWQQINTGLVGPGALWVSSFITQGERLIAGTEGAGTFILNPDLQSWSSFGNLPLNISGTVYDLTAKGDTVIAGAGANGRLYRLLPGESVWTEVNFTGGSLVPAMSFAWIGGELFTATTGSVYRSATNGASWEYAGFINTAIEASLATVQNTMYAALNKLTGSLIYRSTDRGETWILDEPLNPAVAFALVAHGGKIFVAREDGLWLRTGATPVEDHDPLPLRIKLYQNYPNPFNPTTNLRFQIADFGFVSLKVFDVLGREVATLVNEKLPHGNHSRTFDAHGLASGVYLYRLEQSGVVETKRMMLVK